MTTEGNEEIFLGNENFLCLDLDGGYMSAHICQHIHAHLKWIYIIIYKLHFISSDFLKCNHIAVQSNDGAE